MQKVEEANLFVDRCLAACEIAAEFGGVFLLEHPEDLGVVRGERPGSIWQWTELLELIPKLGAVSFALHQCNFGAMTPKPTRFLTNMTVDDSRCYCALPKFDKFGFYKGPLPRQCGHEHSHKLIGKTDSQWNTAPSASYPPLLCEFLAGLILHAKASFGRGLVDESVQAPGKRRRLQSGHTEPSTGLALQSSSVAKHSMVSGERGCKQVEDSGKEMGESPARQSNMDAGSQSIDDEQKWPDNGSDEFDLAACCNSGTPIGVEWDTVRRGFIDGFGLCSPCRWKPSRRGMDVHRIWSSWLMILTRFLQMLLLQKLRMCGEKLSNW